MHKSRHYWCATTFSLVILVHVRKSNNIFTLATKQFVVNFMTLELFSFDYICVYFSEHCFFYHCYLYSFFFYISRMFSYFTINITHVVFMPQPFRLANFETASYNPCLPSLHPWETNPINPMLKTPPSPQACSFHRQFVEEEMAGWRLETSSSIK